MKKELVPYLNIKGVIEVVYEQGIGAIIGLYPPKCETPNPKFDGVNDKTPFFRSLKHLIVFKKFDKIEIIKTIPRLSKYIGKKYTLGNIKKAGENSFNLGISYPFEEIDLKDWTDLLHCDKTEIILSKRINRVVYFGGSFDPIHIGHVKVAEELKSYFDLVVIAPSVNKFKKDAVFSIQERINACKEAFNHMPQIMVLDWAETQDTSSTIKMIEKIEKKLKVPRPAFMVGTDCLENIESWDNFEKLKKEKIVIEERPGFIYEKFVKQATLFTDKTIIKNYNFEQISSSEIKESQNLEKIPIQAVMSLDLNKLRGRDE